MMSRVYSSIGKVVIQATLWCSILTGPLPTMAESASVAEGVEAGTYSEPEGRMMLRSELDEFERYVEHTMRDAVRILRGRKVEKRDVSRLEVWQRAQLDRFRQALKQDDPLVALVDAWAAGRSLTRYLDQPNAQRELPDAVRDVALDMLRRREDRLVHIASRYLHGDSLSAIEKEIDAYTAKYEMATEPSEKPVTTRSSSPRFSLWAKGQAAVGSILQLPLMPGRALKGVSDSGKALSGIRETTAEAVQIAAQLPERIRTEFQIALNDLVEQRGELLEILGAIDSVSTNLRAAVEASHATAADIQGSMELAREVLPAGEALAVAVERAITASTELLAAVERRSAAAAADGAGLERRATGAGFDVHEYGSAAESFTEAAVELRLMIEAIQALVNRGKREDGGDDSARFDVRDYGHAADSIRGATVEIRGLVDELRDIAGDEVLGERMQHLQQAAESSAHRTTEQAKSVIDHFAWRLVHVAVVCFVLACGYAWLRRRMIREA